MNAIAAIALNTFREAIRDRVLYLILAFALALIGLAHFVSLLTIGSEIKIVKDLGLSAISVFGLLTAVFVGVSLVFKEIERRTVYTLLAQPVRRWQFVCGKFAGLSLVLASSVLLTGAALFIVVAVKGESTAGLVVRDRPELRRARAGRGVRRAVFQLHQPDPGRSRDGRDLRGRPSVVELRAAREAHPAARPARCSAACFTRCFPNLDRLNVKSAAVHGIALPPGYFAAAVLYGALYALAVVVLACVIFERREFL